VMFDDLGHVPQEEDPLRTVAAVQAFLGITAAAPLGSAAPSGSAPRVVPAASGAAAAAAPAR